MFYRNEYMADLTLGRLSVAWLAKPYGGLFRAWRGSGWRSVQIWRLRVAVKWAY